MVDGRFRRADCAGLRRTSPLTLTGILRDLGGNPAAGVQVFGLLWGDIPELETVTDVEGRYFFCGLSEEFLRSGLLQVRSSQLKGYELYRYRPTHISDGEFVLDLTID